MGETSSDTPSGGGDGSRRSKHAGPARWVRREPSASKKRGSRGESLLAALLAIVVAGSVLAIGAVHVPVVLVVALLAFAAVAVAIHVGGRQRRDLVSAPALLLLGLAGFTLLQAVPWPIAWLRAVVPQNADVWSRALSLVGREASWAPISLDPGATLVEVTKWLAYAAVFAGASVLASRRGAAWGVAAVFTSAALAALTTIVHGLVGATKVYGLYTPTFQVASWHTGPLLNGNNLAGYLNLGAMCGIGLILMRKPIVPVAVLAVGLASIVGVEIISASRGGVLALPLGCVILVLALRNRGAAAEMQGGARIKWVLGGVLASGVLFALLGATGDVWAELYNANVDKVEMVSWARPLVLEHPWLGIGRGAFESVFPAYSFAPGAIVYTHAEDFVVQWAVEWGLPVTIAAFGAFAWLLRPRGLGVGRSAVATGAWTGVLIVLLQNLFDLALEVPGVCVAISMTLGSLWGDGERRRALRSRDEDATSERRAPLWIAVTAIVGAATIVATAALGRPDIAAARVEVRERYVGTDWASPEARAGLRASIAAAVARHPAEPYFPLLGALSAWHAADESPIPWLQRTLERAPMNGRAHLLLAEVLASRGATRQALFELRMAQEGDPRLVDVAGPMVARWTRSYDEVLLATPAGWRGAALLDEVAVQLARLGDAALRARCDIAAVALDPTRIGPHMRLAGDLIAAIADGAAACADRAGCEKEIESHAKAIAVARPSSSYAAQLRARLLLAKGDAAGAERLLQKGCDGVNDRADCLLLRARAASQLPRDESMNAVERELRVAACVRPDVCANMLTELGDMRAGRGDIRAAVANYDRAVHAEPTEARYLRLADAASRAGEHVRAVDALEKVAQKRGGADAALRARIDAERAAATSGLVRP